jgi:hypothetical protein
LPGGSVSERRSGSVSGRRHQQSLADFGLQPPKARAPLTSEQKTAATVKAIATRKARGTTSKKQKLAISGHVIGVTVTPITEPAASPAAQPASTASSNASK